MLRFTTLAALLAIGACASPAGAPTASASNDRDCFRSLDVRSYGILDDHRVRLHVGPTREYVLTIPQQTRDLDWTHAISVRSVSSFICVGNPSGVQLMGGDPPFPYQVTNIERLPAEAAAQGS